MHLRKIFWLLLLLVLVYMARPLWEEKASEYVDLSFLDAIDQAVESISESPEVEKALGSAKDFTIRIGGELQSLVSDQALDIPKAVAKPEITETDSLFAVHNITIGIAKEEAQAKVGLPLRLMQNEYGTDWHSYHKDYQNYVLLSYDKDGNVNGLYTNQDIISSTKNLTMDSTKEEVRKALGAPLKYLQKGNVQYILDTRDEYDLYKIDDIYVTVFYDIHEKDTVTAIQIIHEDLEEQRPSIYAEPSDEFRKGSEFLLFELTNSARIQRNLPILKWDEEAVKTARKHSVDMAENNYFSHTNQQGKSPFDRMEDDGIRFFVAGENLAYGQYSSIYAHEGLMNSMGHRENIVKADYGYLGVGAAFNSENQPYFTETFFNR
ncbi:CAP-associated domain-containing protein [Planococcus sp. N028]|uniref:CAP-associated domain-containing protein n=1 Tax=Planococcus shixiaomingii TaxID=3058393 RepID=A0ABT8N5U0_9BACL|nr:CAP-associated domain-containing protein [Planococcus sp. N028]MDN7243254.1 CAP-associated domain-containing protein [Planococcus sp. N028]